MYDIKFIVWIYLPQQLVDIEYGTVLTDPEITLCGLLYAAQTCPKSTRHHILK